MKQQAMRGEVLLEQPIVVAAAVLAIAYDRMVDVGEVLANLPESTRAWLRARERVTLLFVATERDVHFDRRETAVIGAGIASRSGFAGAGQGVVDRPFLGLRPTSY